MSYFFGKDKHASVQINDLADLRQIRKFVRLLSHMNIDYMKKPVAAKYVFIAFSEKSEANKDGTRAGNTDLHGKKIIIPTRK